MSHSAMIDPEILEGLRELQAEGDSTFVKTYFDSFLSEFEPRITGMKKALETQNFKKLAVEAHALKSSCANSGVDSIMILCKELETQGTEGSASGASERIKKVEELHKKLAAEIQNLPEYKKSA
jgi:HPt (histidine-containing phosphotransfer) domain-containing protein